MSKLHTVKVHSFRAQIQQFVSAPLAMIHHIKADFNKCYAHVTFLNVKQINMTAKRSMGLLFSILKF